MAKEEFLIHIDLNNNQLLNAGLQQLSTHPSITGLPEGWFYWNTSVKTLYVYSGSGSTWIDMREMYQHPDYTGAVNDADPELTGATVIDNITLTNGHVTGISTRNLSLSDIGAAGVNHTHSYNEITSLPANTILANNTGTTGDAVAITAAQMLVMLGIAHGSLALLQTGTDTQDRVWSAKEIADYVNDVVDTLSTVSNLSLGTRTATTLPIINSNGDGVTLPQATTVYAGLLSAPDKEKIDGIEENANNYVHPDHATANDFGTAITSGLDVLSKVSVAEDGHVTEIRKRTITAADIAAVIFNNAINNGTQTTWTSTKIYSEIQAAINQAQTGALQYKGEYDPSTDTPDIEADTTIEIGYTYVVNATGTFAGVDVESGDMIIAKSNNPGSTADNWQIVNKNIPAIVNATTAVKGIIQLATSAEAIAGENTTKAITPATLKAAMDARVGGYALTIGDGATTSFTISHALNTQDVSIQVQRVSDRKIIHVERKATSTTSVTINCNVPPTSNQYRVIIKK